MMKIKWEPFWYELDQSIMVGDTDLFYLHREGQSFANGPATTEDREVEARILGISHPVLGTIRGIWAGGLDYSFFLENGTVLLVNAEEEPGTVDDGLLSVADWSVEVELHLVQETGLSSQARLDSMTQAERAAIKKQRDSRYKRLLESE